MFADLQSVGRLGRSDQLEGTRGASEHSAPGEMRIASPLDPLYIYFRATEERLIDNNGY